MWSKCQSGDWNEVRGRNGCLEEVWAQFWLVTNRSENRHDVVPMPVSMFGGCAEQRFDESLGRCGSIQLKHESGEWSRVRGTSWGLEVWTQISLLTNRCESRRGIVPMPVSTFGGCSERQVDDLLGTWLCSRCLAGLGRWQLCLGHVL
jgi:hypothetical protein